MTYRNEKLRRAVAALPCVACGIENITQAAHANLLELGKGRGLRASDAELDSGKHYTKDERRELQFQWITLTYIALVERGILRVK
jgi:hypothetical protein